MTTLKNLVQKGVTVDLGLPFELWDEPSVEVTDMKKQVGRSTIELLQRFNLKDWMQIYSRACRQASECVCTQLVYFTNPNRA